MAKQSSIKEHLTMLKLIYEEILSAYLLIFIKVDDLIENAKVNAIKTGLVLFEHGSRRSTNNRTIN